jgi:hydroxylamine dehydrogenase
MSAHREVWPEEHPSCGTVGSYLPMLQVLTRGVGSRRLTMIGIIVLLLAVSAGGQVSEQTDECLVCHRSVTPGIVADWERSRHAITTVTLALEKDQVSRCISVNELPDSLARVSIGCAECHTLNANSHEDTFEHNGYMVHTVVTPLDCALCHSREQAEYDQNLMSHAHVNLSENAVYRSLIKSINGLQSVNKGQVIHHEPDAATNFESCYFCHGTRIGVEGLMTRDTDFGTMKFCNLTGWPNRGVGRINPDGSMGACTACHSRHQFTIRMARQPYTCAECHKGPDVPAYKVYSVSKHGNIYKSLKENWDFDAVPWVLGEDFTAPTCAVCHVSLVHNTEGEVVAQRSHRMNDRLQVRIFGLIYAHPHPRSPNTSVIKNTAGLQLPTELSGQIVPEYLIDEDEQVRRKETMQQVCRACHSSQWVDGHFELFDNTCDKTNEMTFTATQLLLTAWDEGLAQGLATGSSIFDEAIERKWVEQWLFYANTVRFSSAMAGADYGVFADGRWYMSKNIQEMKDWLVFLRKGQ